MGARSLALKLTADTGEETTQQEAQDLINKFYKAYPKYAEWIEDNEIDYCENDHLRLADGWTMYGDNDNRRSVGNMPIQGMGSCILRKAVQLCQDAGLTVILPLHDALYIEYDTTGFHNTMETIQLFQKCMRAAFAHYFWGKNNNGKNLGKLASELIRLDTATWSPDFYKGECEGVDFYPLYIDERAEKEYEQFSKYFE